MLLPQNYENENSQQIGFCAEENKMYKELISELAQENAWVKIQPPCSENDIETAEKAVGYPFPKELRELLLEMNGDQYLLLSIEEIVEQAKRNREI